MRVFVVCDYSCVFVWLRGIEDLLSLPLSSIIITSWAMFDLNSPRLPVSTMPHEAPSGFSIRVATSDGRTADFTIASASLGGNELFWFLGSPVPDIVCSLLAAFWLLLRLLLLLLLYFLQLVASFAGLESV